MVYGQAEGSVHDLSREQRLQPVQADGTVLTAEHLLDHVQGLEGRSMAGLGRGKRGSAEGLHETSMDSSSI